MGRFYQTSSLPIINFAYQAPVELMQKAIEFDNSVRSTMLDQSEKFDTVLSNVKHLDLESENELLKSEYDNLNTDISNLTDLAYNSTNYRQLNKQLHDTKTKFQDSLRTGTLYHLQQRYNQYEQFQKNNLEKCKKDPEICNAISTIWLKNVDEQVKNNPNYLANQVEDIEDMPDLNALFLKQVKELKPDVNIYPDNQGRLIGIEQLSTKDLDLIWTNLFNTPEFQKAYSQRVRYGLPGYADENGNPINIYSYADKNGNIIDDIDSLTKEERLNLSLSKIPNMNSRFGNMLYGSYAYAYTKQKIENDAAFWNNISAQQAQLRLQEQQRHNLENEQLGRDKLEFEKQKAILKANNAKVNNGNKSNSLGGNKVQDDLFMQPDGDTINVIKLSKPSYDSANTNSTNELVSTYKIDRAKIDDKVAQKLISDDDFINHLVLAYTGYKKKNGDTNITEDKVLQSITTSNDRLGTIKSMMNDMEDDDIYGNSTGIGRMFKYGINNYNTAHYANFGMSVNDLPITSKQASYIGGTMYAKFENALQEARDEYNNLQYDTQTNSNVQDVYDISDISKNILLNGFNNGDVTVTGFDKSQPANKQRFDINNDILTTLLADENTYMTYGTSSDADDITISNGTQYISMNFKNRNNATLSSLIENSKRNNLNYTPDSNLTMLLHKYPGSELFSNINVERVSNILGEESEGVRIPRQYITNSFKNKFIRFYDLNKDGSFVNNKEAVKLKTFLTNDNYILSPQLISHEVEGMPTTYGIQYTLLKLNDNNQVQDQLVLPNEVPVDASQVQYVQNDLYNYSKEIFED